MLVPVTLLLHALCIVPCHFGSCISAAPHSGNLVPLTLVVFVVFRGTSSDVLSKRLGGGGVPRTRCHMSRVVALAHDGCIGSPWCCWCFAGVCSLL